LLATIAQVTAGKLSALAELVFWHQFNIYSEEDIQGQRAFFL